MRLQHCLESRGSGVEGTCSFSAPLRATITEAGGLNDPARINAQQWHGADGQEESSRYGVNDPGYRGMSCLTEPQGLLAAAHACVGTKNGTDNQ